MWCVEFSFKEFAGKPLKEINSQFGRRRMMLLQKEEEEEEEDAKLPFLSVRAARYN